jgi:hypothetical protein
MKGSEFVQQFGGKGPAAWEAAAFELAREGSAVDWPMVPITLRLADGSDHASVG